MSSALVVLSGGQDSTTCLYWAKRAAEVVHAITFDYGQRHVAEVEAAMLIAERACVQSHTIVQLGPVFGGESPLTSKNSVPLYSSLAEVEAIQGVASTFVPGRNIGFLALAASHAVALGCTSLVTGICQTDYSGYPDCRESFRVAMEKALREGLDKSTFRIVAPLMDLTKAESVKLARTLPGCWEALAFSHTCYSGEFPPQPTAATWLRVKGFLEAGEKDPLLMRALSEGYAVPEKWLP